MNKSILIVVVLIPLVIGGLFFINNSSKKMPEVPAVIQQTNDSSTGAMTDSEEKQAFSGEKGTEIKLENDEVKLSVADFETNKVRFFNTTLSDGKTVYYLVLKDKDGNFRAAANANKQCAAFGKGYRQVGDEIECLTCNKKYPLSDFAIEQPDCNPYPINSKLPINNGQIIINSTQLESVANLF